VLAEDGSLRGAVVSALAGDTSSMSRLTVALASAAPIDRARAALGLALLGSSASDAREQVERAIEVEHDAQAFRALAQAALVIGARVEPARLDARIADPATAPEALALAAHARDASPRTRQRLRRAARRALRADDPRVRAGAAMALAESRDRAAWRALAVALDDEHDAVRLAAARALGSLRASGAREAIAARERVERDRKVRAALRAALAPVETPPPAALRGSEVLYVRIATAPGVRDAHSSMASDPIEVDVLLPDGRWLRTFALERGEVLVPDVPGGEADVQVRL
jgi:hypothetical protein